MCDTFGKVFDGSRAIFSKNSDRSANEPQFLQFIEAKDHDKELLKTTYIEIKQVKHTNAVLLSSPSWIWGCEMGVNEYGVCIGNEAVNTKGEYGKTGLIGMDLVRLGLERGNSAKQALEVIISLLEEYGQGGNCGFDRDHYYDNSYLLLDENEMYILETAGKNWVYKKVKQASISNILSIGEDGDTYSDKRCNFKEEYKDDRIHYSSMNRKAMTEKALESLNSIEDAFKALRGHENNDEPFSNSLGKSVCMHEGPNASSHTTGSMVVELNKGKMNIWVTGRSLPCVSLFKPVPFGLTEGLVYKNDDDKKIEYWKDKEVLNRRFIGKKVPSAYYSQRDEIEKELINSKEDIKQLAKLALEKEEEWLNNWRDYKFEDTPSNQEYVAYWRYKTL